MSMDQINVVAEEETVMENVVETTQETPMVEEVPAQERPMTTGEKAGAIGVLGLACYGAFKLVQGGYGFVKKTVVPKVKDKLRKKETKTPDAAAEPVAEVPVKENPVPETESKIE